MTEPIGVAHDTCGGQILAAPLLRAFDCGIVSGALHPFVQTKGGSAAGLFPIDSFECGKWQAEEGVVHLQNSPEIVIAPPRPLAARLHLVLRRAKRSAAFRSPSASHSR